MVANIYREREGQNAIFYKDTHFFQDSCSVITKSVVSIKHTKAVKMQLLKLILIEKRLLKTMEISEDNNLCGPPKFYSQAGNMNYKIRQRLYTRGSRWP